MVMVKFKYKEYEEKINMQFLIIISSIYFFVIFAIIITPGNIDLLSTFKLIMTVSIISIISCGLFYIIEKIDYFFKKKKDKADVDDKGFYVIGNVLVIIGLVKSKVVSGISTQYGGTLEAINYYVGNIDLRTIEKIILRGKAVNLYYRYSKSLMKIRLYKNCESPYKLAEYIACHGAKYGCNFIIKDKNNRQQFKAIEFRNHLDSFEHYNKNGIIKEENGVHYTEEEGAKIIQDIVEKINQKNKLTKK